MCDAKGVKVSAQVSYTLSGAVLGVGAPIGAFLIRILTISAVRDHPAHDLRTNLFFYLYQLIGTCLLFAAAGFLTGRRADRLRRGEEFYHVLADRDPLTGLYNARVLSERIHRALERAVRTGQPISMMMIDVDHLKALNDRFGHQAGDAALRHVANALRSGKGVADAAARWGGDEFVVLLEGADANAAMRVAENVVTYLRNTPVVLGKAPTTVTATIGVATANKPDPAVDLLVIADRALYAGKARGRNTIEQLSAQPTDDQRRDG